MTMEIPFYGLRAYALLFSKHSSDEEFDSSDLDWIVSESMKKKIFALLVAGGWLVKIKRNLYRCRPPQDIIHSLMEFKIPRLIRESERPYAFTGSSAVEIWSDYCYVQRSMEKSPYFIKVLKSDLEYWKKFFHKTRIPTYVNDGKIIGEYVVLIPVEKIDQVQAHGISVEPRSVTMKYAKANSMYAYAYGYIQGKYGDKNE
jgi:hypothetical protein